MRKSFYIILAVSAVFVTVTLGNFGIQSAAAPNQTINWSTAAPSPIGRSEALGTVVGGKLYVFGGYTSSSYYPTGRSDVYNPATNTWTRIPDMRTPVTHGGVASDRNNIYIAGGYKGQPDGTGQIFGTKEVWKYNVGTKQWTPLPSLPEARGAGEMELLNGQLHFFGGRSLNRVDQADHWVLNLNGGTQWTLAAPLPKPRNHVGDAVLNGKIYVIGGQTGNDETSVAQSSVYVWDPARPNTWTTAESLPRGRAHTAGATFVMDGQIFVVAGEIKHNSRVRDVTAYNPQTNSWRTLTPLPAAKGSGVAGDIGNEIFYTTGVPGFTKTTYKGVLAN